MTGDRSSGTYENHTCTRVAGNGKDDGRAAAKSAYKSKYLFPVLRDAEDTTEGREGGLTVNLATLWLAPYTYASNNKEWVAEVVKEYMADKRKKIMAPAHGSRVVTLCKQQETCGDYCKWMHQGGKKMREILLRNKQKRLDSDDEDEDEEDPGALEHSDPANERDMALVQEETGPGESTEEKRKDKNKKVLEEYEKTLQSMIPDTDNFLYGEMYMPVTTKRMMQKNLLAGPIHVDAAGCDGDNGGHVFCAYTKDANRHAHLVALMWFSDTENDDTWAGKAWCAKGGELGGRLPGAVKPLT